ncbi:Acetyltransferase (GNAT) family protein [Bryocella elongata]|uniref:Acetyltransferase (GNAT) family protein n=1 Tax=Bryocella elongata TaxID=863522 RepID=A0A1H6A6K4_9BACT|nr:GNAT family N-acetyltransferase [Bryocella elongata]SEG44358.1 Acetyltransferase (GNAT) family protein [Bryocella elongata]
MDPSPASSLHLRPIRLEDAAEVAVLSGDLGYERTPDEIQAWIDRLTAMNAIAAANPGVVPAQAVIVACEGVSSTAKVVGWIEVSMMRHLQYPDTALIGGLVVSATQRSQGTGRALCRAAEDWAREQGVSGVRVTSRSTRERAHQFYLRDGYARVKTSEVFEKNLD